MELLEPHVNGAGELPDQTKSELAAKLGARMSALIETAGPTDHSVEDRMADAAYLRMETTESEMRAAVDQQPAARPAFGPRPRATDVAADARRPESFGGPAR